MDSPPGPWLTVVGVVSAERHPLSGEPMPALYRPGVPQSPPYFIVRGSAELTPAIRRQIWSVSPDQPVLALGPMDKIVAEARSPVRFGLVLLGSFAAAALTLAAMGIYAVMAYIVKTRSHEIGVRMALGARKTDILGLVLLWAAVRLLSRMLYGISATDPLTFGGVSALLVMVSVAAAYLPARRAARIDPISSLKYE